MEGGKGDFRHARRVSSRAEAEADPATNNTLWIFQLFLARPGLQCVMWDNDDVRQDRDIRDTSETCWSSTRMTVTGPTRTLRVTRTAWPPPAAGTRRPPSRLTRVRSSPVWGPAGPATSSSVTRSSKNTVMMSGIRPHLLCTMSRTNWSMNNADSIICRKQEWIIYFLGK